MDESDVLCPLENRRTPRELYVKLFVVNFTVLLAYVNLLGIRGDRSIPFRTFLVFVIPISGLAQLALPLAALVFQAILYRGDWDVFMLSFRILFGGFRGESYTDSGGYNLLPASWRGWVVQLVLQIALLMQSVTTIALFYRRVEHGEGTDSVYDHWVPQLGILGLSVAILSMIDILFEPEFPGEVAHDLNPYVRSLRVFRLWRVIHIYYHQYARGSRVPEAWYGRHQVACNGGEKSDPTFRGWLTNYVEASIMIFMAELAGLRTYGATLLLELIPNVLGTLLIFFTALFVFRQYLPVPSSIWSDLGNLFRTRQTPLRFALASTMWFGSAVVLVIIMGPVLALARYKELLLGKGSTSIAGFANLHRNKPCPQAWKDPVADWIWWLA